MASWLCVAGMGQYFGVCTAAIRSGHGPHYLSTTALDNVDIDTAVDNVDIDTAGGWSRRQVSAMLPRCLQY